MEITTAVQRMRNIAIGEICGTSVLWTPSQFLLPCQFEKVVPVCVQNVWENLLVPIFRYVPKIECNEDQNGRVFLPPEVVL